MRARGGTMGSISVVILTHAHIASYLHAFSKSIQEILHVSDASIEYEYVLERLAVQQQESFFFVILLQPQMVIGAIEIRLDEQAFRGQIYCWLHEAYRSRGIFQHAMQWCAHYYFEHTQSIMITARIDCINMRSYKAFKKAGFMDGGISDGPYGKQYELLLARFLF